MYELKRMNSPAARSQRGILPALTFPACAGAVHPRRRRTESNWAWLWKRRGKGSEDMVMVVSSLGMDCKGLGRERSQAQGR
jgi:hypothetical protein